ncbi:hypothetical protein ACMFMF_005156 [Clarireedia jacksonii]
MNLAMEKQARVAGILKRGLILDSVKNPKAFNLMHHRLLARLFKKHPTLCDRLCAKAKNAAYNPGFRADLAMFRDVEKHKDRIEEYVENACRLDEAVARDTGPSNTQPNGATTPSAMMQGTKHFNCAAAETLDGTVTRSRRKLSSDILNLPGKVTQSDPPSNNNISSHSPSHQTTCRSDEPYIGTYMSKGKPITSLDLYGISESSKLPIHTLDQEMDKHLGTRYQTRSVSSKVPSKDTDTEFHRMRLEFNSVDETFSKRKRKEGGSAAEGLESGDDDNYNVTTSSPSNADENDVKDRADELDDEEEHFTLRETIEGMEYIAEHPWICGHTLVHHFWDEYKVFQEYIEEAHAIERENERQELIETRGRKVESREESIREGLIASRYKIQRESEAGNERQSEKWTGRAPARTTAGVMKLRAQKRRQEGAEAKTQKNDQNRKRDPVTGRWL